MVRFREYIKIYFVDCPLPKANGAPASHILIIIIPKGQLSQYAFHYVPFLASRGSRYSRLSSVFDIDGHVHVLFMPFTAGRIFPSMYLIIGRGEYGTDACLVL